MIYSRINGSESKERDSGRGPSTPSIGSGGSQKAVIAPEPSIDFELDIKVKIDSGQCVLHPNKDPNSSMNKEEDQNITLKK